MDELLCQSLLLFRQYRFYDAPECGEKAFRILEEAHVWMGRTQECVDMAKWGCVIECLAQKYYIEDDTDAILEEIDAALVAHWKRIEKIHAEVTTVYLWLGYYFLLRFRNRESRSHSRCKQIMSSLLCALVEIFRKVEKGGAGKLVSERPEFVSLLNNWRKMFLCLAFCIGIRVILWFAMMLRKRKGNTRLE